MIHRTFFRCQFINLISNLHYIFNLLCVSVLTDGDIQWKWYMDYSKCLSLHCVCCCCMHAKLCSISTICGCRTVIFAFLRHHIWICVYIIHSIHENTHQTHTNIHSCTHLYYFKLMMTIEEQFGDLTFKSKSKQNI